MLAARCLILNSYLIDQGRIQDLSEGGGGQDFLGTKKLIIRKKNVAAGEFFFLT